MSSSFQIPAALANSSSTLLNPFTLIPFFLCLFYLYKWFPRLPTAKRNLPPSPPMLPLIGNLHQLGTFPHRSLQRLSQKYGELMLIKLGKKPVLIVSSANAVKEIVKNHDVYFSDRPHRNIFMKLLYNKKGVIMAPYGEHWRQMRTAFVLHITSNSRVRFYSQLREEETSLMIEKIQQNVSTEVNLTKLFMSLANGVICRIAYGDKCDEDDRALQRSLSDINELIGAFYVGEYVPWLSWIDRLQGKNAKGDRVKGDFDRLFDGIIQRHLDNPPAGQADGGEEHKKGKDFVDVLIEYQKEKAAGQPIDTESIKAMVLDTFGAGTDATYALMEWTMSALLKSPIKMQKLQEEIRGIVGEKNDIKLEDLEQMKYLKAVIKESLRLHPPSPLLVPRKLTKDVNMLGYDIPAGTEVITNVWAIHKDPSLWDKPEEFIPERFLNSNIEVGGPDFYLNPFGAGRRGCPGYVFAMASAELVLATLIHKFNWALPEGTKCDSLDMVEVSALTLHKRTPLIAVPSLPFSK